MLAPLITVVWALPSPMYGHKIFGEIDRSSRLIPLLDMSHEALVLGDELPSVKVHPSVVFDILNSFSRREDLSHRVVGTLLGVVKDNCVEVRGRARPACALYSCIRRVDHRVLCGSPPRKEGRDIRGHQEGLSQ